MNPRPSSHRVSWRPFTPSWASTASVTTSMPSPWTTRRTVPRRCPCGPCWRCGGLPGNFPMLLWKIHPKRLNGWNLQPSPMKRKENDLNQTSMIMVHVNLPGCIPKIHFGIGNILYFFPDGGLAGVWLPYEELRMELTKPLILRYTTVNRHSWLQKWTLNEDAWISLWLKMGDILVLWWFTRVLFSPSFPIKNAPETARSQPWGFLVFQTEPPGSVFRQAHAVEAATGRGLPWCWFGAWGSGNSLCYLVVFGTIKKFLDLWVEYLQFPWKGVNFLFFFPVLRSTSKKHTVFVREFWRRWHFILCNIRSTKDEEKNTPVILSHYTDLINALSMVLV